MENRSFHLSLDVCSWAYRRSLQCDREVHKSSRQIAFTCRRCGDNVDFKINGRVWQDTISLVVSVGTPFALDPPETDFGAMHEFATGVMHHYPALPRNDCDELLAANVVVPKSIFHEMLLYRSEVRTIVIQAGGDGATLDFDGAPRWTGRTENHKHLFIYSFDYVIASPR